MLLGEGNLKSPSDSVCLIAIDWDFSVRGWSEFSSSSEDSICLLAER